MEGKLWIMKRILGFIFIVLFVVCSGVPLVGKAAVRYETTAVRGKKSMNISAGDYLYWANPTQSYLYRNADGTYNRVECIGKYIYSETYTVDFQYRSQKKIRLELPVWGGVYISDDAYYVMLGKKNIQEKEGVPEFRLIKYDKTWKKMKSVSIVDANTTGPFVGGSCRFARNGEDLYVRSCHEMYKSADGLNHQASVMFRFRMSDLAVLASYTDKAMPRYGYVSHSFNQFLAVRDGKLYTCDHGDGYNRAVIMMRFDETLNSDGYSDNENVTVGDVYPFYGKVGENYTGAALGGFIVSDTHCIAVGNSVKQTKEGRKSSIRNIYVVSTEAYGDFAKTELMWITNYSAKGKRSARNPQLVQISNQRQLLIWEEECKRKYEYKRKYDRTCYVLLDGTGKKVSCVESIYMPLSDCQPIVSGGNVVWYVTDDGAPTFYSIPIDGSAVPKLAAKTKFKKNGIKYKVIRSGKTQGEVSVVGCQKSLMPKDVSLDTVDYGGYRFQVTAIAKNAFKNNKKLTWLLIGPQVSKIGAGAFQGCSKLNGITMRYKKYTSKNIGEKAFSKTTDLDSVLVFKKKISAYRKLLRKKGISSKVMLYKY